MQTFWVWLLEATAQLVDPSVLQSYEHELRHQLQQLIQRTEDPVLRAKFIEMLDCPIVDTSGRCREFSEYVYSALVRNGVHNQYDIEAALSYIMTQMIVDRSMQTGKPRPTLFGAFDERRPYRPGDDPLQARFLVFLQNAISNIRSGRITRLADLKRPPGAVSISSGRSKDQAGYVLPEEIPDRPSAVENELIDDLVELLRRKETAYGLPLVDLFRSMLDGDTTKKRRKQFGRPTVDQGRQIIIHTIEDYARSSGNDQLLHLINQLRHPNTTPRSSRQIEKPKLTDKQRDYLSIVSVVERRGGSVTHSVLGSLRNRWLGRAPRDPNSPHRNRLEDVLANMVSDGVLDLQKTRKGGRVYVAGPRYEDYLDAN